MSQDQELEKQIAEYQKLAKENPNIDINLLMSTALKRSEESITTKSYKWPYMISLGVPPFGLIYAFKLYLSGDDSDKTAARICVLLTAISLLATVAFGKIFFSTAGVTPAQIESIKPTDAIDTFK